MDLDPINKKNNTFFLILISILSIVVPVLVAILLFIPQTGKLGDLNVSFLPHLNAILNSATAICLLIGYYFIKQGKQKYHTTMMLTAFGLSSIFLICYVVYHYQGPKTYFGDINGDGILNEVEKINIGSMRYFYFFILITHIILATMILPLILLSIYWGLSKQYMKHKKLSKWTFPLWLYVAVTGVIVYFMISPYYIH